MAKKEEKIQTPLKELADCFMECLLLLIICCLYISINITSFDRFYHGLVVVDGPSMYPTLNGHLNDNTGNVYFEYGKIDTNREILKYLNRFDIVACYYPDDFDAMGNLKPQGHGDNKSSLKVKRLCAFPNETVEIDVKTNENGDRIRKMTIIPDENNNDFNRKIEYIDKSTHEVKLPYDVTRYDYLIHNPKRVNFTYGGVTEKRKTLGPDEYLVLGDNWDDSKDSRSVGPISFEMIHGIIIEIDGKCTYDKANETIIEMFPYAKKRLFK